MNSAISSTTLATAYRVASLCQDGSGLQSDACQVLTKDSYRLVVLAGRFWAIYQKLLIKEVPVQFDLFEEPLRFEDFSDLLTYMESMEDDPLFQAGTNMVIYRGNPEAKIMIVGEAPGTEEDRQGKPFVGRSGQLLDQILAAVDLDSEQDVFITNAVFRLPPGSGSKPLRKPTPEEISFYKPFLLEIVRLIDPVIILLSGNAATESVLGQTGITKLRGQWFPWHGRWVMPIFHPAYLLRNPTRAPGGPKALTWQDIQNVRRKYDEILAAGRES